MPHPKHRYQELFEQVQFLKGVGPDRAELLHKLGIHQTLDLLFFFPKRYEDFSNLSTPTQVHTDVSSTSVGTVVDVDVNYSRSGKLIITALIELKSPSQDPSLRPVNLSATWFNLDYLATKLVPGQTVTLQGVIRQDEDRFVMTQPKISWSNSLDLAGSCGLLPVYALTEGINQDRMRKIIKAVVEEYTELLDEVFPLAFLQQHELPGIHQAVRQIHLPLDQTQLDAAQRRLIFQELFVQQLALAMRRRRHEMLQSAPQISLTPVIKSRILNRFPFELTASQLQAIDEIAADMNRPIPMNRLLHGEVGSGKTAVATFAILQAVAQGFQAVMMAPTEILVEQHLEKLNQWLAGSRVHVEAWTGSLTDRQRLITASHLREGKTSVLVGTQALLHADLEFANLGLVVIDEQHKFGVRQRARLRSIGGSDPHYLVMTATPIPRSISMTLFGDLDVSVLQRQINSSIAVNTYFGSENQREQWWSFFRKKLQEGRQGYVIAPWVDSEKEGQASAEHLFERLTNGPLEAFRVDLLHGRMKSQEKIQVIHAFARGHTQVLVATGVVEVGIDVPNATVMTIESAERFGLSQLHQLRGRVARGCYPGFVCAFPSPQAVLNDPEGLTERRLQAFVNCTDGFELAEIDMQLRGPGDFFSDKQHGFPTLRIADVTRDQRILFEARDVARELSQADPNLENPDFEKLRRMVVVRYGQALELSDVG
ncbi:MAG TPA: ATP-dependent DNA helicase RecG [Pirellulaceae bacterium]|nr:ATP-dependent DNA helicase RecG [Pirellulaceae bacterium]HMO90743.1 ATP-dependent DNA helicase RecG [Pirellulaceae bacterium]HMP67994.1 ATP-dependent DNA helicase RecG [Pirellulaceae bacterium]